MNEERETWRQDGRRARKKMCDVEVEAAVDTDPRPPGGRQTKSGTPASIVPCGHCSPTPASGGGGAAAPPHGGPAQAQVLGGAPRRQGRIAPMAARPYTTNGLPVEGWQSG